MITQCYTISMQYKALITDLDGSAVELSSMGQDIDDSQLTPCGVRHVLARLSVVRPAAAGHMPSR